MMIILWLDIIIILYYYARIKVYFAVCYCMCSV